LLHNAQKTTTTLEMQIGNGSRKKYNGQQKRFNMQRKNPMTDEVLILRYYNKGLQAELSRLPFFGPVGPIDSKEMLAFYCAIRKKNE